MIEGKQLATAAAMHLMRLCKAILQGCRRQLQEDDLMVPGIVGIQSKAEDVSDETLKKRIRRLHDIQFEEELIAVQGLGEILYRDSITG